MLILTSLSDFHVYTLVGFVTVTSLVKKKLQSIAGQTYFQKLYPNAIAPTWLKYKLKKKNILEKLHTNEE